MMAGEDERVGVANGGVAGLGTGTPSAAASFEKSNLS